MNTDKTEWLTMAEFKKKLNIGKDKARQLIDDGQVKAMYLGPRTIRINAESVEQLINDGGV